MNVVAKIGSGKRVQFYRAPPPLTGEARDAQARHKLVSATRAKTLNADQFDRLLAHIRETATDYKNGIAVGIDEFKLLRDTAMVLLSFYCGLRAQEIAGLKWKRNILTSDAEIGKFLHVTKDIGKRTVAREIPLHPNVRKALKALRTLRPNDVYVIPTLKPQHRDPSKHKCPPNTIVQFLRRMYAAAGFIGCTSHSGRRTFGTNMARRCNEVGGSVRDVQHLLGHRSLVTTEAYIEPSDREHKMVGLVF